MLVEVINIKGLKKGSVSDVSPLVAHQLFKSKRAKKYVETKKKKDA